MASTAQSAQGTVLNIGGTTGGAKTITGATQANPVIITSTAHGFSNGDIVTIATVGGMTQLNGGTFVVSYVTTNTFALSNTNGLAYSAYTSGGTATPTTWTACGNVRSFDGLDGQSSEIDITNFASTGKEFLLGLYDGGSIKLDIQLDNGDAGQQALRLALQGGTKKHFKLTLPSGTTPNFTFDGFVKQFTVQGGVDAAVSGSVTVRISGGYTVS